MNQPSGSCPGPGRRVGAVALMWSLVVLLLGRGVRAEPQPSTIVLAFDSSSEVQTQAIAAIQAHVKGLPLEVVLAPVEHRRPLELRLAESSALATERHALGTFYVDVGDDRSLLIFFTEADGEATLIRRLPPSRHGLRVALEQVAIVARSLVESLLDGGSVGIGPTSEPSPPSPRSADSARGRVPRPPRTPDPGTTAAGSDPPLRSAAELSVPKGARRGRLAIGVGGAITSFATGAPWQGGISIGAHWLVAPVLYLGGRYTAFPALALSSADATFSVRRHPVELLVGYRPADRLALNAEVGVLVDRTTRTTQRTAALFLATAPDARWSVAIGARGGVSWAPWAPVWASFRVGADAVLTPYSYSTDTGRPLASPRWLRPRLELELAVWLW